MLSPFDFHRVLGHSCAIISTMTSAVRYEDSVLGLLAQFGGKQRDKMRPQLFAVVVEVA